MLKGNYRLTGDLPISIRYVCYQQYSGRTEAGLWLLWRPGVKVIACIEEQDVIDKILTHLREKLNA